MAIFVLVPTTSWLTTQATEGIPSLMLRNGDLAAYSLRGNGTLRHLELVPVGSDRREVAEWIYDQVEDGMAIKAVARELHASLATVRRYLMALELTEQVEAGEWDDLRFSADGEPQWLEATEVIEEDVEEDTYPEEPQDANEHIPGADCEPTGTTGDELEATLAASLA